MEPMIYLAGIARESTVDGPGVRLTVFFQGCPHHCPGCHNPETWRMENGQKMTVKEALDLVEQQLTPLHRGITLSGGDPFAQPQALLALVSALKARHPGLDIWCYTGYRWEDIADSPVLPLLDVLVDGRFIEEEKDLDLVFRGSRNQRLIDVAASLQQGRVVEWSR